MKRSELWKILKEHGCKIVEHGSNHDKVYSPITNKTFPLWRHAKDMKKGTVDAILKQAGIK
ncbi:MAG: type II toxin-antitoxin system HicA family toxin [Selenomonas sp.]|jgi:predicted RNA binding protein YcfA (HicA-like mRNA interferase family)|uniref:Type II toxin-antitoxin system HicA family toxin n=1 Tax=Selenomonas ruminantium TaxID=971 RepID=A0A927ZQQ5_SELRU|nr:type II toxin-antitoxin system HicA family toxin [Selenomonas ruminantium]MBO6202190.1 type II toxin-antitoxin system HicA family toxin [Selenomonas sp.]